MRHWHIATVSLHGDRAKAQRYVGLAKRALRRLQYRISAGLAESDVAVFQLTEEVRVLCHVAGDVNVLRIFAEPVSAEEIVLIRLGHNINVETLQFLSSADLSVRPSSGHSDTNLSWTDGVGTLLRWHGPSSRYWPNVGSSFETYNEYSAILYAQKGEGNSLLEETVHPPGDVLGAGVLDGDLYMVLKPAEAVIRLVKHPLFQGSTEFTQILEEPDSDHGTAPWFFSQDGTAAGHLYNPKDVFGQFWEWSMTLGANPSFSKTELIWTTTQTSSSSENEEFTGLPDIYSQSFGRQKDNLIAVGGFVDDVSSDTLRFQGPISKSDTQQSFNVSSNGSSSGNDISVLSDSDGDEFFTYNSSWDSSFSASIEGTRNTPEGTGNRSMHNREEWTFSHTSSGSSPAGSSSMSVDLTMTGDFFTEEQGTHNDWHETFQQDQEITVSFSYPYVSVFYKNDDGNHSLVAAVQFTANGVTRSYSNTRTATYNSLNEIGDAMNDGTQIETDLWESFSASLSPMTYVDGLVTQGNFDDHFCTIPLWGALGWGSAEDTFDEEYRASVRRARIAYSVRTIDSMADQRQFYLGQRSASTYCETSVNYSGAGHSMQTGLFLAYINLGRHGHRAYQSSGSTFSENDEDMPIAVDWIDNQKKYITTGLKTESHSSFSETADYDSVVLDYHLDKSQTIFGLVLDNWDHTITADSENDGFDTNKDSLTMNGVQIGESEQGSDIDTVGIGIVAADIRQELACVAYDTSLGVSADFFYKGRKIDTKKLGWDRSGDALTFGSLRFNGEVVAEEVLLNHSFLPIEPYTSVLGASFQNSGGDYVRYGWVIKDGEVSDLVESLDEDIAENEMTVAYPYMIRLKLR